MAPTLGPDSACRRSTLDADERRQPRHLAGQTRGLGGIHHGGDVLVGSGGLLGDAPQGGAADQDAAVGEVIDHPAPIPTALGLMAAHGTPGPVTGGSEGPLVSFLAAAQDVGARAHGTAYQHGLARSANRLGQFRVARTEGAGGALAMDEKAAGLPSHAMSLHLAGIVGDVVEEI